MRRRALALTCLAFIACSDDATTLPPDGTEAGIRARLGIPDGAKRVVLFGQNAHLDIDWQQTFDGYYQNFVGDILTEARDLVDKQPRAYYSVAEMAYLKHHVVDAHPEELAPLQAAAKRGALHVVGGGMTSPDTLLPETELLARDFLDGARFAEDTLGVRPTAAYLPDSFGHAATAPDVLAAAGFSSVFFARIDGAPTIYETYVKKDLDKIKPGSDAELLRTLGSADFVWTGAGGSSVLAHYQAAGFYCTGDNIDYDEDIQVPGDHLGVYRGDEPGFTDGQIDKYVAELGPYARTPYLFVPVGCDFQHPKTELIGYLDGYNQRRYPTTGVWVVDAPFDTYAQLVGFHKDELPSLKGELSPYFMGFYGSRADVKRAIRDAAAPFFVAESFATVLGDAGAKIVAQAAPSLELLTRADHHDFVTGTANDMVATGEQLPLLATTGGEGNHELDGLANAIGARLPAAPTGGVGRLVAFNASDEPRDIVATATVPGTLTLLPRAVVGGVEIPIEPGGFVLESNQPIGRFLVAQMKPWSWRTIDLLPGPPSTVTPVVTLAQTDSSVVLSNAHVKATVTKSSTGWALTSVIVDGTELLGGPSFTVTTYDDSGGLWRLGNEMTASGCSLTARALVDEMDAVKVVKQSALNVTVQLVGQDATREFSLDAGSTGLDIAVTLAAPTETTRTAAFVVASPSSAPPRTGLAGGFAERAVEKVYTPTYWPAVDWASLGQTAILLRQSTGVRFASDGTVELMAVRNAPEEACDAEGGKGSDGNSHRVEWRLALARSPADAARAARSFDRPGVITAVPATPADGTFAADESLVSVEGAGILSAIKPADRGGGVILRALLLPGPVTLHLGPRLAGKHATRVDLVERDLEDLGMMSDTITLEPAKFGPIASVRLK